MKVTEHFDSSEFNCRDGTIYPIEWIEERLLPLCRVLETIRARVGHPVFVDSGYRTPPYNKEIGGAKLSQHLVGKAADIRVGSFNSTALLNLIRDLYNQDIIQIGGLGWYPDFVHVDIRESNRLATWTGRRSSN